MDSACFTRGGRLSVHYLKRVHAIWSSFGSSTANMTDSDSDDSIFLTQSKFQTNVTTETDYDTDKVCDTVLEIINDSNHSSS
jgi:hypothetical protein